MRSFKGSVIRPAVPQSWQLLKLGSSLSQVLETGPYLQVLAATKSKFIVSLELPGAGILCGQRHIRDVVMNELLETMLPFVSASIGES